ncbi:MAG: T9SS type A sorting domain-containing protein [Bacteroidia bacterium]
MKKSTLFFLLILSSVFLFAQNPLVKQWDKRFGGNDNDILYSFQQTIDGGFILGGWSDSDSSGDKTQNIWGYNDYWIVKTDSMGNKQWDKDFGGTEGDFFTIAEQTDDGGYILGGFSFSDSSGDKTQDAQDTNCTAGCPSDYWIVKIDALGNKQWDKTFGGFDGDELNSLQQTADRGYILGGTSYSDIGGDKTQINWGLTDYWIIKIDSLGNKQWDKDFGGTNREGLYVVHQTIDGGYILGGSSISDSSGDKTENSWGNYDFWIVKTDSLGNKQWDKDYGGTEGEGIISLLQTADGGYFLGGPSNSDSSGDKTQNTWGSFLDSDYWIVKTDSLGNKQWDKDFGGGSKDVFSSVQLTSDGGYILGGYSESDSSGDKTEYNLGLDQTWIIKTDSIGNKQWDKTLHTPGRAYIGLVIETKDGCYAMANYVNKGIGGDKTQSSRGGPDYWIIKFCDSTLTTSINPTSNFQLPISISPNPFISEITIIIQNQNIKQATITVKNILGQTVYLKNYQIINNNFQTALDLNFLSKGIYLLEINIDGERMVKKIVKE